MISPKLKGTLLAFGIFAIGFLLGGSFVTLYGIRLMRQAIRNPVGIRGPADRAVERIGGDLKDSLGLTPEQTARVQEILDRSASNLKGIKRDAADLAYKELERATAEIAATLPKEKHPAFYQIIVRRYERLGLPVPAEKKIGAEREKPE